jgi:hypothetical protein
MVSRGWRLGGVKHIRFGEIALPLAGTGWNMNEGARLEETRGGGNSERGPGQLTRHELCLLKCAAMYRKHAYCLLRFWELPRKSRVAWS